MLEAQRSNTPMKTGYGYGYKSLETILRCLSGIPKTTHLWAFCAQPGPEDRGQQSRRKRRDTGKLSDPEVGTVPFSLGLLALIIGIVGGSTSWVLLHGLSLDRWGLSPREALGPGSESARQVLSESLKASRVLLVEWSWKREDQELHRCGPPHPAARRCTWCCSSPTSRTISSTPLPSAPSLLVLPQSALPPYSPDTPSSVCPENRQASGPLNLPTYAPPLFPVHTTPPPSAVPL